MLCFTWLCFLCLLASWPSSTINIGKSPLHCLCFLGVVSWSAPRLVCWLVGWLAGWLVGRLDDYVVGCLVGWLAGCMAGSFLYLLWLFTALLCFACLSARLLCLDICRFALALLCFTYWDICLFAGSPFICWAWFAPSTRVHFDGLLAGVARSCAQIIRARLAFELFWSTIFYRNSHPRMVFWSWAWFFGRPLQEGNFEIFLATLQLHQLFLPTRF